MKILLIGNYDGDRQESMSRYTHSLSSILTKGSISNTIFKPKFLLGKINIPFITKWLGYLDKYFITIIYLIIFQRRFKNYDVIHICDHSNSIYRPFLPPNKVIITCHDVLAIKGALGDKEAFCESTFLGLYLQKTILKQLLKTKHIICVSNTTCQQLNELSVKFRGRYQYSRVIYNTFNQEFMPISTDLSNTILSKYKLLGKEYILHVGSSLARKNKEILLEILAITNGFYLVVTKPLAIKKQDLECVSQRLIELNKLSTLELNVLYQNALAFVFPSFSEGFGWPIIEAQICGTPVVCSDIDIFKEVAQNSALFASPTSPIEFVKHIESLRNNDFRNQILKLGKANLNKFDESKFITEIKVAYQDAIYN